MPRTSEMLPSKYLKKTDFERPTMLTISRLEQENVGFGDEVEQKWVMYFEEMERGLVMNSTNIRLAELACNSDDTDDWTGKKIVLYDDPNISFGGKLVGGIRLRAPSRPKDGKPWEKKGAPKRGDPHPSEPLPAEADDDQVPF
jgi:hypothetical protein